MVEKLLEGPKTYYMWLIFLLVLIAGCGLVYLDQLQNGLSVTGLSRDVSWGLYISQFTYFVGVAASAVMSLAASGISRRGGSGASESASETTCKGASATSCPR